MRVFSVLEFVVEIRRAGHGIERDIFQDRAETLRGREDFWLSLAR